MKISGIQKYLKQYSEFDNQLANLGLEKGPSGVWYYRRRGEFLDIIDFWVSSSGAHMEVAIVCFKYELIDHCDMSKFPKGFNRNMPNVTETSISKCKEGVVKTQSPWTIENEEELSATLKLLAKQINGKADSWLKAINSDKKYFSVFTLWSQEEGYASEIRDRLDF